MSFYNKHCIFNQKSDIIFKQNSETIFWTSHLSETYPFSAPAPLPHLTPQDLF